MAHYSYVRMCDMFIYEWNDERTGGKQYPWSIRQVLYKRKQLEDAALNLSTEGLGRLCGKCPIARLTVDLLVITQA